MVRGSRVVCQVSGSSGSFWLVERGESFALASERLLNLRLVVLPRHCVVLLTGEGDKFAEAYEAFLTVAVANTKDTLKFVHIYNDRQPEFADALLMDEEKYRGKSAVRVSCFIHSPLLVVCHSNSHRCM